MLNNGGLGLTIGVNDMVSKQLNQMDMSVKKFTASTRDLESVATKSFGFIEKAGGALVGLGVAVLSGAYALAGAAAPFDAAMQMLAHRTNATTEQFGAMQAAAFSAENILRGFTATESAQAMARLAKEGANARESMSLLGPALLFAGITSKSAEDGAGALAKTLKEFRLGADDAGHAVDVLATASKLFHVDAGELANGLTKTASGAQLVGASMDDAVLAIGLARQVLPDTANAAMAANKAFIQLANPKTASGLKALGVEVQTASGSFRGLPDILGDIATKTAGMSASARAAALSHLFGARAAGGMAAIVDQLSKGIDDGTGKLLTGAAAVDFLKAKMNSASGAAAAMRDVMLDSFSGQKKVLGAALDSLETALAVPFARAFKPLAKIASEAVAKMAESLGSLSPATGKFAAQGVLLGGVLAVVAGGALLLGGEVLLPLVALFGVGALAAAAFHQALKSNVGGIGDLVSGSLGKAKLAFQGVMQLFSDGGFSGAVRTELNKAENGGVKNFALNIFVWVERIKNFFSGIATGFSSAIAAAGPTFTAFANAIKELASRFGFLSAAVDPLANGDAFKKAGESGKSMGATLAKAAEYIVRGFTAAVEIATGFIDASGSIVDALSPIGSIAVDVGSAIADLANKLGLTDGAVGDSVSGWHRFGEGIAAAVAVAANVVSTVVDIIGSQLRGIIGIVGGVVDVVAGIFTGNWSRVWLGAKEIVYGFLSGVTGALGALVGGIARSVDAIGKLFHKDFGAGKMIDGFRHDLDSGLKSGLGLDGGDAGKPHGQPGVLVNNQPPLTAASVVGGPFTAATAMSVTGGAPAGDSGAADLAAAAAALKAAKEGGTSVHAVFQVDGQTLAEVVARAQAGMNARGALPGGVPT